VTGPGAFTPSERERLEHELARQKSLVEASHVLHSTLDQKELLGILLSTASRAVDAERGTVYLFSEDRRQIWSQVASGAQKIEIRLPLGRGIAGTVAQTGETIRIDDPYSDSRFDPSTDKRLGFLTRSILCVPIKNRDGVVVGVFQLLNRREGHFEASDVEFLDALSVHAALAIENAILHERSLEKERQDREIKVAQDIQRALLPAKADLEAGPFRLAGSNELCEDASGDYYDFVELEDGRIAIAVGDVSGHGLGSALVMASARAFLRAFTRLVPDLADGMTMMNEFLSKDMTNGKFMSLFVGILDPATRTLSWSSAGHNAPVLWRAATKDVVWLDSTCPVLGVIAGVPFARGEDVVLAPGDVLLLYTDGATEAVSPTGEQFGEERLQDVVQRSATKGVHGILTAVTAAIHGWTGGTKNRDDITLLAVAS
jgi:sigma-B regulation protein RsbU (phosphoserine phosphatase)